MRKAAFQHWMVSDYLLAEEGGVCGKLNDSSCCLQIGQQKSGETNNKGNNVRSRTHPKVERMGMGHVFVADWPSTG